MKKENFLADLMQATEVARFNKKTMHAVAGDMHKNIPALIIIALGGLLSALGMNLFLGHGLFLGKTLGILVYHTVSTVIAIYIMSLIAKSLFNGHAKHDAFFRVIGFSMIVGWLMIFPRISLIAGLWAIALLFVILKEIHKLSTLKTIMTFLLTLMAMGVIQFILAPTFGDYGMRNYEGGRMWDKEFKMDLHNQEGDGSVRMKDGRMTIEGPNGEAMEIEIPDYK